MFGQSLPVSDQMLIGAVERFLKLQLDGTFTGSFKQFVAGIFENMEIPNRQVVLTRLEKELRKPRHHTRLQRLCGLEVTHMSDEQFYFELQDSALKDSLLKRLGA